DQPVQRRGVREAQAAGLRECGSEAEAPRKVGAELAMAYAYTSAAGRSPRVPGRSAGPGVPGRDLRPGRTHGRDCAAPGDRFCDLERPGCRVDRVSASEYRGLRGPDPISSGSVLVTAE